MGDLFTNGNGASAVNTDAVNTGKANKASVGANGADVKERNLVRQIRRRLDKHGQTLRKIRDHYYVIDLNIWRTTKPTDLAWYLGIIPCELCGNGSGYAIVDRLLVCRSCEATLTGKEAA